jgi:hypothetical protein
MESFNQIELIKLFLLFKLGMVGGGDWPSMQAPWEKDGRGGGGGWWGEIEDGKWRKRGKNAGGEYGEEIKWGGGRRGRGERGGSGVRGCRGGGKVIKKMGREEEGDMGEMNRGGRWDGGE